MVRSGSPLLKVRGLVTEVETTRGVGRPVDGVDMDIYPGEIVGLVGESGSGKSMCARSLTRLEVDPRVAVTAGSVEFRGRDLMKLSTRDMASLRGSGISMVFQDPATYLNPVMTVGRQIEEAVERSLSAEARRARVGEILDLVGLPGSMRVADRYPHELSGGMKQRALIAIALASNPELLIADEPTTALDVTIQAQILALLRDLQRKLGMAVLLITHDLGVIAQICDYAYVMYASKIVEGAPVHELFRRPEHPYTAGLVRSALQIHQGVDDAQGIPGRVPDLYARPGGCVFQDRCTFTTDLCRTEPPELNSELERVVACHHVAEVRRETGDSVRTYGVIEDSASSVNGSRRDDCSEGEPMADGELLLRTVDLRMEFPLPKERLFQPPPSLIAVNGLDLEIRRGESIALVGESGSGKSTIARLILGLLQPSGGEVIFEGAVLADLSRDELHRFRRRAQMVFQNPYSSLNPTKPIGHILRQPYLAHQTIPRSAVDEAVQSLLDAVGLPGAAVRRYPHQLSGGERQRVALARAMSLQPSLIVADEPVSALDMSVRAQILHLMRRLRDTAGVSYLLITHELSSAQALTDRVVVLYLGRVLEEGPTREVLRDPIHPYTKALVAATPSPDPSEKSLDSSLALRGEIPSASAAPRGCVLHPRCPFAQPERCHDEVPQIRVITAGRSAACHFAEEIAAGTISPKTPAGIGAP